jgi:hypothetical protein
LAAGSGRLAEKARKAVKTLFVSTAFYLDWLIARVPVADPLLFSAWKTFGIGAEYQRTKVLTQNLPWLLLLLRARASSCRRELETRLSFE